MAKPECLITGGAHTPGNGGIFTVELGDEIVTYQRIECTACGEGLRNDVINTKRKPQ